MLQKLKPSRKKISKGDVFIYKWCDDGAPMYGLVLSSENNIGWLDNLYLVCLYRKKVEIDKDETKIPFLRKSEILMRPVSITNNLWTKGYFETVSHIKDINSIAEPINYIFKHRPTGKYFNENADEVAMNGQEDFVLTWGCASREFIDEVIADSMNKLYRESQ